MRLTALILAAATLLSAAPACAAVRITEWMYNGMGTGSIGEFVELTNVGGAPIDMTGWSFDDDSRTAGVISLSSFGVVAPGESVILTDNTATAFRTDWSLAAGVKIIGGNSANLSRNDEINVFDSANALVDRLTYGDQNIAGSIRTNGTSGVPQTAAALGANDITRWILSSSGDGYQSRTSAAGDVGSPGFYAVPEPGTGLLGLTALMLARSARRRGAAF